VAGHGLLAGVRLRPEPPECLRPSGRILKGDKSSNLPVMQATKLEFVIDIKTEGIQHDYSGRVGRRGRRGDRTPIVRRMRPLLAHTDENQRSPKGRLLGINRKWLMRSLADAIDPNRA
jgi:hypothetical protein